MVNKDVLQSALSKAKSTGADFAEIFCENTRTSRLYMADNKLEEAVYSTVIGVGVRIFQGTRCIYAYGNDISPKGIETLAQSVADALGSNPKYEDIVLNYAHHDYNHPIITPSTKGDIQFRADKVKSAYFAAKEYSPEIVQVYATHNTTDREILIANSEGLLTEDVRSYTRLSLEAIASTGTENQSGIAGPGAHMGNEFLENLDTQALGREAARQAVTMLHASICPAGKMPVVLANGFGGVIFHEACGHSLEATSVAKGNSVFCNKLNQQIAHPKVTAIDDGTIKSAWGSLNISDEGEPVQRIVLLENGILKNYMIDKLGARRMNMPSTGSGRRQSYKFAPTSRMTNTYIAPGTDKNEDIIASVDYGLYAKRMGGGSVNPITGEFNFAVLEGYLIRNGKIAEPVRGATLIGKGHEILFNIDMIGQDLAMDQGMCGSESGSVPVNVGQPMLRISQMLVGGKSI